MISRIKKDALKVIFALCIAALPIMIISCEEPPCYHKNVDTVTVSASCTEAGMSTVTCKDCGFTYVSEINDATGHSFEKSTVEPECCEQGYTVHECERCGYSYSSDYKKAKGHDFAVTVTEPTCDGSGSSLYKCKNCDYSCTGDFVPACGHELSTTVTEPTCSSDGFTLFACSSCDFQYTADLTPKIPHTYTETSTPASCTEQGCTTYTCACGDSYSIDFIPPLGHSLSALTHEPTCADEGWTEYSCENCDYSFISDVQAPTGHSFTKTVANPTVSDMGFTRFSCSCGFEYVGNYTFYSSIVDDAYADSDTVLACGIDVSKHNCFTDEDGNYLPLEFAAIANDGIDYVILKAGSTLGDDPAFEVNYQAAREAGLDIGVYFYTYATNTAQIAADAEQLLAQLEGKSFEYPIYLDLEDESLMGISSPTLTEMCMTFFTKLQASGYYTGLYVNNEWLNNILQTEKMIDLFDIWYARYPSYDPAYPNDYSIVWNKDRYGEVLGMWQYSDNGVLSSVPDMPFDLNYCYKDYPSIIRELGLNGLSD